MAHFDDILLSERLRFGSVTGPQMSAQILFTGGGHRKANQRWDQKLRHFELRYARQIDDVYQLLVIWEAVEGPVHSFLIRDWNDWNTTPGQMKPGGEAAVTAFDQPMRNTSDGTLLADGVTRTFQLMKRYRAGSAEHLRVIKKPQQGTLRLGVGGAEVFEGSPTDFTVDYATGLVTFQTAPGASVSPQSDAAVTWGGAFHVPVAFAEEQLDQELRNQEVAALPNVPLIEVRL